MDKIIKFGEAVDGYDVPVLNEREIRASAGILFLALFGSYMQALYKDNYLPVKYFITLFLTDFIIRVFINPKYAPTLIMGRLIVRNQVPEYVGAAQKRFAWIIGVVLSAIMFVLLVVVNALNPITIVICVICQIFLFFETAFGICLGCKFYAMLFKEKVQYCPGEVCDLQSRQSIQKTSNVQVLIVFGFIAYILLTVILFNDHFSKTPYDLFGLYGASEECYTRCNCGLSELNKSSYVFL